MDELTVKKDFTDIYMQKSPNAYLKEMERLDYCIPDKTKPLYLSLITQLYNKLSKPINVLDIGSSYGINSSLMKYGLSMSELNDFFSKEPTKEQSSRFFDDLPSDDRLDFYQIDISESALKFSEDVKLCEKGLCVNLETENLPIKNIPQFDLVIATGCIGYIGFRAFSNLFEFIKKQHSHNDSSTPKKYPFFAFSVLRIFDMNKIKKTFENYGYSIVKIDMKPIRQRKFSDSTEKQKTISLLHGKKMTTKWLEDDGNFYADFYIAGPKKLENQLISMSKILEK